MTHACVAGHAGTMSQPPYPPPPQHLPVADYAYNPQAQADDQHLRLLRIFHYVWAGLIALISCVFVIHIVLGIAMLRGAMNGGPNPPPREVGYLFVAIGAAAMLLGWVTAVLNFLSARGMAGRKWRMLSFIVAGLNCLSVPIGTTLGVFTFIVLMRPSVAAMYGLAVPIQPVYAYAPPPPLAPPLAPPPPPQVHR